MSSFADEKAQRLFHRETVPQIDSRMQRVAFRKLRMLDAAVSVEDLRSPPGNRLERLKGDRKGQYSNRINDQWRICFYWTERGAEEVEIVDYH